jgi:uncharacterized protein YabE (DUF348 family)
MNRLTISSKNNRPVLLIAIALLCFVVFASFFAHKARAVDATDAANEHIITLHDDGIDKGFITKATTLRAALQEANIRLDSNDRTEPALDDTLVASSYEVNIYRARPVIVRDGKSETKIITAFRTPKQIADQAGLKLHDEDNATLSHSEDMLADGAAEILTIHYATPFTFVFYGKTLQSYSQAKTVGEMLALKGVNLAANDTVTPSVSTPLVADMTVQLWKNGEQTVTVDEDVAFETEQIKDSNHEKSFKEVKTPGVNGKRTVTYKIVMQNGVEVSRQALNSVTTKEAVKQVEIVGTKSVLPPGSHTDWMAAAGISSSDYGYTEFLIAKESGWNPSSMNQSSGACGLVQALPCSKLGPNWDDPIVALRWGNSYVGRYGGWEGAYNFWITHHWY